MLALNLHPLALGTAPVTAAQVTAPPANDQPANVMYESHYSSIGSDQGQIAGYDHDVNLKSPGGAPVALPVEVDELMRLTGRSHLADATRQVSYEVYPPHIQQLITRLQHATQRDSFEHAGVAIELADGACFVYSGDLTSDNEESYSGTGMRNARHTVIRAVKSHTQKFPDLLEKGIRVYLLHTHPGRNQGSEISGAPIHQHQDGRRYTLTHDGDITAALLSNDLMLGSLRFHVGARGMISLHAGAIPVSLGQAVSNEIYVATYMSHDESESNPSPANAKSDIRESTKSFLVRPATLRRIASTIVSYGIIDGKQMASPEITQLALAYEKNSFSTDPSFLKNYRHPGSIYGQSVELKIKEGDGNTHSPYHGTWKVVSIQKGFIQLESTSPQKQTVIFSSSRGDSPFRAGDFVFI